MATKIPWCDEVLNVTAGCTKCSPGCLNCYAERMAKRLAGMEEKAGRKPRYGAVVDNKGWMGNVICDESLLDKPLHWKKPRRIFIDSMSDIFGPKVPFGFIDKVLYVMYRNLQHTFLILTKRPKVMLEYFTDDGLLLRLLKLFPNYTPKKRLCREWPLDNVHLGISISNQAEADEKIPILLQIPAVVRWLSIEPMLSKIDLHLFGQLPKNIEPNYMAGQVNQKLHGVIVGGESGPGARLMHPDWPRSIRDQCVAAGVPFYFKQWGEWLSGSHAQNFSNEQLSHYKAKVLVHNGNFVRMFRVGKKLAGDLLDGRKWKQLPK